MERIKLLEIMDHRYEKIRQVLVRVREDFALEDIHQFRLEVKKLRALLQLTAMNVDEGDGGKLPEKLHDFYLVAGRIRNLQLQGLRVMGESKNMGVPAPGQYFALLEKKKSAEMKVARKGGKGKRPFAGGQARIRRKMSFSLTEKRVGEYIRSSVKQLEMLVPPFYPGDEQMHAARKILKGLQYNWAYIALHPAMSLPLTLFGNKEDLQAVASRLGEIQDECVAIELLASVTKGAAKTKDSAHGGKERKVLEAMKERWENKKEAVSREVHEQLRERMSLLVLPYIDITA